MYKALSAVHTGVNQLGEKVRLEAPKRGPPGFPESGGKHQHPSDQGYLKRAPAPQRCANMVPYLQVG